ncbi:MAG: hypothetical protein JW982_04370 [Spirochaetes bacterium]|nr:hypothetical protein [Spirochaetota bacterium]
MSKGGFSIFSALMFLFFASFALMSIVRFVANTILPQETLQTVNDQFWRVFLQISDAGAIAEDTDGNILNKVIGILTIFLGLILFSSLVAFITSQFEAKLDELKKGKSLVIEKNHTLILGFGDRVLEIIRELIIANESEKSPAVVVLSELEKDEMDDFFRERIEDRKTTRIITRSGSTSSLQILQKVSVNSAKSIIILNDVAVDASDDDKFLGDARVLKTIMAVVACTGEENVPPILAELHMQNRRKLAENISPGNISIIDEHTILAKLMVQTSRISGLALVYSNMIGFDECEFYFYEPSDDCIGKKYIDIMFHFRTSTIFGFKKADGAILINPDPETVFEEGDKLILLAEDDSTIKYLKNKLEYKAAAGEPAAALPKVVEKQLIIGWSQKAAPIVEEYSKYLIDGSSIDVVVHELNAEMQSEFDHIKSEYPGINFTITAADIQDQSVVAGLKPEKYDNVIILTGDGGNAELRDSETISRLITFRHYFKNLPEKNVKTQLITEVADSDNIEVIQEAGVKDFLISNQFVSKMYAQISEEPEVLNIYEDLFNPEGSEVYIKPVNLFLSKLPAKMSFGEICASAIKRKETCFGIKVFAEEKNSDKNYGIYINPDKDKVFSLSEGDALITLAEDES